MRYTLREVVNADRELVGPVTVAVTDREISALQFGVFVEVAEAFVVPVNYFVWNDDAETVRSFSV